eukprot:168504_1
MEDPSKQCTYFAFVGLSSVILSTLYRKKQTRIECNQLFWDKFWTYVSTKPNHQSSTKQTILYDPDDKQEAFLPIFDNIFHSMHIYRSSPCIRTFAADIIRNHLNKMIMHQKGGCSMSIVHRCLQKNPLRILFPLCGSTYDMLYLSHLLRTKYHLDSQLFTIIGIESSAAAITHFFTKNELALQHSCYNPKYMTSSDFYRVGIYSNQEHSIRIIQSDVLEYLELSKHLSNVGIWRNTPCLIEGKSVDIVMDINAMSFIDPSDRKEYSDAIKYWLKDDGTVLLNTVYYEPKLSNYPPFSMSPNDVHKLFENNEYKLLESVECMNTMNRDRVNSISQSWLIKR